MTDIERIKSAINLADLVGKHYQTTGNGRYVRTTEHDSLVIDTKNQSYHWYSKAESGDMIDWVGRHELSYNGTWNSADPAMFKESVCWLASYAGLPEPQFRPESTAARAERLTNERLLQLAADTYRANLNREIQAYQYAVGRGFTPQQISQAIGYADGLLWQRIPEQDRPAAAALGLIYLNERNQWRDAIYRGHLVYIHTHRAKVDYLSGRFLEEKRHCNLRTAKRLFWAFTGYHQPLIIVEGQADALSVQQLGANGLALCGTNLSDFDQDYSRLFEHIYVWQDSDAPGSEAAKAWGKRLADLANALGPMIRVVNSPAHDANDWLQAGATAADLAELLKTATTYLDAEIDRLAELAGAELYDELEPLFGRLSQLDVFQLNIYRSQVCKKLNISQGDFGRYMKAAKGQLAEDEEAEFSKGGQYVSIDGWTVLKQFTDDGKPKIMTLANGTCKILEEVYKDDGSNEPELDFIIAGELATGHKLPRVTIPATDFAAMKWPSKWGSRFILSAGRSTQDHFRAAVQHLSGTPHRRTIYTHTGWRKINSEWAYLTSAGALGIHDDKVQVDLKAGRSETNMDRYNLPLAPTDVTAAVQASLKFWTVTEAAVTVPIWAAMFLAPLSPFLMVDFGLWIHGKTGSMKSSYVAACLAHYGTGWTGKDGKVFLPSNFQSTANAILLNAFMAKDAPLVIDDFAPGATQKEVRERDQTASNLLRSVGNKAARGRMRDGRHFQADFPPRCLAIITAEDLPPTASIMARGIGVRVQTPPKGTTERRAIEQRLSRVQTEDSHLYATAMAGYLLWIQRHWDELAADLPKLAASYRDQMQQAGHSRLPDAFGKLMAAVDTALFFAIDVGAITKQQATEMKRTALAALGAMMAEHGEAVESVDACRIFQELLVEQLDARQWYLARVDGDTTLPPENSPIGAICAGYYDDTMVYLLSKTVSDVIQLHNRMGAPFPVGRNTLYQRLIEAGWLQPTGTKPTSTIYVRPLGTSPRVLIFKKSLLLPE